MNNREPHTEASPPPTVTGWRRWIYLGFAGICFGLGALGAALPALPTTPFLLLTSYFLVRTSPRLHRRLLDSRLFGPILEDWYQRGGIRRDVKIQTISTVLIAVALTLWVTQGSRWPTVGVVGGACVGIAVILRVRTVN